MQESPEGVGGLSAHELKYLRLIESFQQNGGHEGTRTGNTPRRSVFHASTESSRARAVRSKSAPPRKGSQQSKGPAFGTSTPRELQIVSEYGDVRSIDGRGRMKIPSDRPSGVHRGSVLHDGVPEMSRLQQVLSRIPLSQHAPPRSKSTGHSRTGGLFKLRTLVKDTPMDAGSPYGRLQEIARLAREKAQQQQQQQEHSGSDTLSPPPNQKASYFAGGLKNPFAASHRGGSEASPIAVRDIRRAASTGRPSIAGGGSSVGGVHIPSLPLSQLSNGGAEKPQAQQSRGAVSYRERRPGDLSTADATPSPQSYHSRLFRPSSATAAPSSQEGSPDAFLQSGFARAVSGKTYYGEEPSPRVQLRSRQQQSSNSKISQQLRPQPAHALSRVSSQERRQATSAPPSARYSNIHPSKLLRSPPQNTGGSRGTSGDTSANLTPRTQRSTFDRKKHLLQEYPMFRGMLHMRDAAQTIADKPISWVLKVMDDLFDARYAYEMDDMEYRSRLEKQLSTLRDQNVLGEDVLSEIFELETRAGGPKNLAEFMYSFFLTKHGIQRLAEQYTWNTLHGVERFRRKFLDVEIMGKLLDGTYGEEDLVFFLFARTVTFSEVSVVSPSSKRLLIGRPETVRQKLDSRYVSFKKATEIGSIIFQYQQIVFRSFVQFLEKVVVQKYFDPSRTLDNQEIELTRFLYLAVFHYHNTREKMVKDGPDLLQVQVSEPSSVSSTPGRVANGESNRDGAKSSTADDVETEDEDESAIIDFEQRCRKSCSEADIFATTHPVFFRKWMGSLCQLCDEYLSVLLCVSRSLSARQIEVIFSQLSPVLENKLFEVVRHLLVDYVHCCNGQFSENWNAMLLTEDTANDSSRKYQLMLVRELYSLRCDWYDSTRDGKAPSQDILRALALFAKALVGNPDLRHEVEPLAAYFVLVAQNPDAARVCSKPFLSLHGRGSTIAAELLDPPPTEEEPLSSGVPGRVDSIDLGESRSDASELQQ